METIPEEHPLQQFFLELVGRHYAHELGIRDPQLVSYVAHLLSEFCDAEQLLKIRNAAGKPLQDLGEMLIGLRAGAILRSRAPGAQAHWRLYALLRRHVSGKHQSFSPAPPAGGELRGLGESGKRKLLHRLEIRALRIHQGGATFRAALTKIRAVRLWIESGEK
jgi:hypothetical protein